MFCKKCGAQMKDDARFCPRCGASAEMPNQQQWDTSGNTQNYGNANASDSNFSNPYNNQPNMSRMHSDTSANSGYGYTAVNAAKKTFPKTIVISAVAVVATAAITVGVVTYSIKSRPFVACALGLENLQKSVSKIKNGTLNMSFSDNGYEGNFSCDFELNAKKHTFFAGGQMSEDDYAVDFAVSVEDDEGTIALKYDGEVVSNELNSSDLEETWDAFDESKNTKDLDFEKIIEENDLEDEIEDYIDVDELNDTFKKTIKKLLKISTQKDIEKILDVEKSGFSEKTYSIDLDGGKVVDFASYLLELVDDTAGDTFKGNWFDDALDAVNSPDLIDTDIDLGELSWSTKGSKLTNLSYDASFDGDFIDTDDINMNCNADFEYSFSSLKSATIKFDMSSPEELEYEIELTDINHVKNVKDSVDDDLMDELS